MTRAITSIAASQVIASAAAWRPAAMASTVLLCAMLSGCGRDAAVPGEPTSHPALPNGQVVLSSAVIQKLGVRTAAVEIGVLPNDTRVPAVIGYDEHSIVELYAPVAGWVDKASVRARGDRVRPDQLLFEIYSPVLVTTDAQYLRSLETGADPVDNAFARGLLALGLSEDMITALRDKRRKVGRIPFRAVDGAVVTALNFRQGAYVQQGASLLQLAAVDPVWANLQLPEALSAGLVAGTPVTVTAPAYPGWTYEAKISYVYPQLDAVTRTLQARVVLPSRDPVLLPDMFVSVVVHGVAGNRVVTVPNAAVIRGGRENRVIVALGDGHFAPRAVRVGQSSGERTAILSGLQAGEQVVTRAAFLIDSEANLRSSLERLDSGGSAAPAAPADSHAEHHH